MVVKSEAISQLVTVFLKKITIIKKKKKRNLLIARMFQLVSCKVS